MTMPVSKPLPKPKRWVWRAASGLSIVGAEAPKEGTWVRGEEFLEKEPGLPPADKHKYGLGPLVLHTGPDVEQPRKVRQLPKLKPAEALLLRAEEAREYGYTIEAGWKLRLTGAAPPEVEVAGKPPVGPVPQVSPMPSLITPEGWEFKNLKLDEAGEPTDYTAVSPQGQQMTKAEFEASEAQAAASLETIKAYRSNGGYKVADIIQGKMLDRPTLVKLFGEKAVASAEKGIEVTASIAALDKYKKDGGYNLPDILKDKALDRPALVDLFGEDAVSGAEMPFKPPTVLLETPTGKEDLFKLMQIVLPDMVVTYGMTQAQARQSATDNLLKMVQNDPQGFVKQLQKHGRDANTDALLKLLGIPDDIVQRMFQPLAVETALKQVMPDMSLDDLKTMVKTDFPAFLKVMQTGGRTKAKQDLLIAMNYSWNEVNDLLSVQRVVVPVDGVRQLVTTMPDGRAYDAKGKLVGTYSPVINEFTSLPDEGIVKDFWDALKHGTASAFYQTQQYLVSSLPNFLFPPMPEGYLGGLGAYMNETNKQMRDAFRQVYAINKREHDKWEAKHPELEAQTWIMGLVESMPLMVAAMAGTAVGVASGNPIGGAALGLAIMTPAQTQDVRDSLLAAGAPEDQADALAVPIGGVISAIEVVADLPYLKNISPALLKLFRKEITNEVASAAVTALAKKGLKTFTQIELTETLEEIVQQAVQNAAVKFFDKNQPLLEGLLSTAAGAALMTFPLAVLGAGGVAMAERRVPPSRTQSLTDEQMKAKGWRQDPETGNWYERVKEALLDIAARGRPALKPRLGIVPGAMPEEVPPEVVEPGVAAGALPEGWRMEIGKVWPKHGIPYEAEVNWQRKVIVFRDKESMANPLIANHEIGHVRIETLPDATRHTLLEEYAKFIPDEEIGWDVQHKLESSMLPERIAIDYGQYLTDASLVEPRVRALFEKYPALAKAAPKVKPAAGEVKAVAPPAGVPPTVAAKGAVEPGVIGGVSKELWEMTDDELLNVVTLDTKARVIRFPKDGPIVSTYSKYLSYKEGLDVFRQKAKKEGLSVGAAAKGAVEPGAAAAGKRKGMFEAALDDIADKIAAGEPLTLEEEQIRANNPRIIEDLLKAKAAKEAVEPEPVVAKEVVEPEAEAKEAAAKEAVEPGVAAAVGEETLPDRVQKTLSQLEADVNITRKRVAGIRTSDATFARLALKDANRLINKARSLVSRMEKGQKVAEEEIGALEDKIRSLKDYYKFEKQTTAEVKQKLVNYIKTQLPLPRQGELLAKVKNVKTEAQLAEAIARVDELAEAQAEKTLRADIIRELKKTAPRIEKGITVGRLTPEVQSIVDKLRANLLVGLRGEGGVARNVEAYEAARAKIEQNIVDFRDGKIAWDALQESNEELKYTGLYGMSSVQLQEALDYIQELKQTGKDARKAKREAIKEQRKEVVGSAVTEITGGQGIKPGVGVVRPEDLQGIKKVLDQPVNSQYGFVNLLDKLGKFAKGTKQYQGFLMRFNRLVQQATNTENKGREETFKGVRDKLKEIYGTKSTRDATRLIATLCNEDVDLGTFKIVTTEGVQYMPLKLTRAQMMEAYQLYKNPKNLETFRDGMHWTSEIMTKIVATLTEQDIAWADWLQNEFYDTYYDKINPFYEQDYNIAMPKNPDYVPQSHDFEAGETDEVQMLLNDQKRYASVTNKSLKARQENIRPFQLKGVFTVLTNHIVQMEHFMAWAETMHELRSTFGNSEVRTAIRQYHSNDILKRFDDYMNDFARGGVDRVQFLNALDKLRSRFTVSVLALKPSIGLQQIWTVGAFMTEMKVKDFVTGLASFWKNPVANYKWMMENSTYLKNRYQVGNYERDIRLFQQQGVAKAMSGAENVGAWLLWQVKNGDKFGVMPGWWAKYQAGLKEGLSQADAMLEADSASERTQNTSELASLSGLQRGSSWGKMLTMFQSQPNKYFRIIADNLRNMQYGRQSKVKGITNLFIVWVLLPSLFQWVADAFKWKEERQARVLLLGPLNNILVAGQLVQTAWGWFTDDSFDWQASPALSTVRDAQSFAMKTMKIINQIKNPYEDVAMDDVVSAIEFFAKGIGQFAGAPTPYLIMVERAIRDRDPRELVFSRWALEEPTPDLQSKTSKLIGRLGQITEDVTDLPIDKKPQVYDTRQGFSDVKQALSKTLPSDVTEKNGFNPQVVSIAQAIRAQDMLETFPNKRLFEIIDGILDDNTLNYTFSQYYIDYQDRQKITSLAKLKEWDAEHPRFNLGNVTPEQYMLMRQYEVLDKVVDKKQFRKDHPALDVNPYINWLKSHPKENAQLALFGQATVLTMDAYNEMRRLVKALDIPDDAVQFNLPPEGSVETHFRYEDMVAEGKHGSWEAQLLLLKDAEAAKKAGTKSYAEWKELKLSDTPIASLELRVKNREKFDLLKNYGVEDSPDYIKDEKKRAEAAAKLRHTEVDGVEFRDIERRVDAIEKGTAEVPTSEEVISHHIAFMRLQDEPERGSSSAEAMLYRVDNPRYNAWRTDKAIWGDNALKRELFDTARVLSWRIDANYRREDAWYNDGIKERHAKITYANETLRDNAIAAERKAYMDANPRYRKDDRRREAYNLTNPETGEKFPTTQVESYVAYNELAIKGFRRERFLIENPALAKVMKTVKGTDLPDPKKIPDIRYDEIYEQYAALFAQLDEVQGDKKAMGKILADNPAFARARRLREGYGLLLPEDTVIQYGDYYALPDKGMDRELYLAEHPDFDKAMRAKLGWLPPEKPRHIESLRISVKYAKQDMKYDAYGDYEDPAYIKDEKERAKARASLLKENSEYAKSRLKRAAYDAEIPDKLIDTYVEYASLPPAGPRRDLYLLEHPDLDKAGQTAKMWKPNPDRKGIEYLRIAVKYEADDAEWNSYSDPDSPAFIKDATRRADARDSLLARKPEYAKSRRTRDAMDLEIPESFVPNYVEYFGLSDKGWTRERYLKEHQDFYKSIKKILKWVIDLDFNKIPSQRVERLYATYQQATAKGKQDLRARFTELDSWLYTTGRVTRTLKKQKVLEAMTAEEREAFEMQEAHEKWEAAQERLRLALARSK